MIKSQNKKSNIFLLTLLFSLSLTFNNSYAASLQVSPILIDIEADRSAASVITLRNTGTGDVNAQVRVFKWTQSGGKDVLSETNNVVASPPLIKLSAASSNVIRVVRTVKEAPIAEESYRLVIDELPNAQQKAGTVAMLVRHSVPVFFSTTKASAPKISWNLQRQDGKLLMKAVNSGDRRIRLANMSAGNSNSTVDFGKGLNGYVLGNSTFHLLSKTPSKLSGTVALKADTNAEPLNVQVTIK